MNKFLVSTCTISACIAVLGVSAPGLQQAQKPAKPVRFGDVVLSGFKTASFELGVRAAASGPETTLDMVNPKDGTKARLQAEQMTAVLGKPRKGERGTEQVERVEVEKRVRFSAERPAGPAGGVQRVSATGSRGILERAKGTLTLEGPVTFRAERPSEKGGGSETVTGSADRATYDEPNRVLVLSGNVEAVVVTPNTPAEGSSFSGDEVRVEMATEPYKVSVENLSLKGRVNMRMKQEDRKPVAPR